MKAGSQPIHDHRLLIAALGDATLCVAASIGVMMSISKALFSRQALLGQGGNFLLFHLLWLAAIFGAVAGSSAWALLVLCLQIAHGVWLTPLRRDLLLLGSGLLVGTLFELALIASGLIEYQLQLSVWAPPLWILALWVGFAQSFNHSLAWLSQRLPLAALAGGIASVMSLYGGISLGAASTENLPLLLAVYALSWSVLVPAFAALAARARMRKIHLGTTSILYD